MPSHLKAFELRRAAQRGVTLVELMVAMTLGLVVVLAASVAFLAGKKLFNTDVDVQAAQESLRFTRYVVQSVLRQAGYVDYAPDRLTDGVAVIASNAALLGSSAGTDDLNVVGASNTAVKGDDSSVGLDDTDMTHQNDSLLVRFFGRSKADADEADATMVDCLGHNQKGPSTSPSPADRAWSFFYVAAAGDAEPTLYCKYRSDSGEFRHEALARGVEKFKVLYGHDSDGDSVPDSWLEARGIAAKAQAAGTPVNAQWRKVVAVRVGIVVRSERPNSDLKPVGGRSYRLYPMGQAFEDSGIYFDPPDDGRFRRVATFTLMLRNVMKDPA